MDRYIEHMIKVINPQYKTSTELVINTTSRSNNWSAGLSPFFLGPISLYGEYVSKNMENAWQYSKVYEYYLEDDGAVGERYFKWAQSGWDKHSADRYPMGKGSIPLYSYWDGQQLTYTEARKKIYIPLYAEAVKKTSAFMKLKEIYEDCQGAFCGPETLYLWDFDAHNLEPGTFNYWDLANNPNLKFGHAYVLAMLLEGIIQ